MNDVLRNKIASMQQCQDAAQEAERELCESFLNTEEAVKEELNNLLADLSAQGATRVILPTDISDAILELWQEQQHQLLLLGQSRSSMRAYLRHLLGSGWHVVPAATTPWPDVAGTRELTLTVKRYNERA